ncbi:FtsB family cell division protein [Streptococcus oriscaviae]|uniref:Septum formation initiator family protein n=1 Tax=Streptococcus oriscaviae TaxID=2781599 RepID=A0ABX7YIP5_9STRE|nr:septum formation initiator family protein [Streptococcus oriscaviae]QUE53620.1 septum formation initiator family protein [Streptococcus oriscaviae]
MKKSNILQINNQFIQDELQKTKTYQQEKRRKNRFMASILILVIFLFILPTYNLVESYNTLKKNEAKLVELQKHHEELSQEKKVEEALLKKLQDEDYAAKYIRARYQFSKDGEIVYNIPGLLPK